MSASLAHFQLGKAAKRVESALAELDTHLGYVAEAEMEKLARRFPTRRVEIHSGMGSTCLRISKRKPYDTFDDYNYSGELAWHNWPDRLEVPAPDLWSAINMVQDLNHGRDPGFGSIIYDKGKRIAGL
jgi:hypothetical protein